MVTQCQQGKKQVLLSFLAATTYNEVTAVHEFETDKIIVCERKKIMAEFGENLKRIREEKGITQQTLADYLYVTRQAVSRWEGGSRYPDLMTAKKMAQYLGISLDELLSDEDMQLYVQKNAIMESSGAKKVQTFLCSVAFMSILTVTILWLCNYFLVSEYHTGDVLITIMYNGIRTLLLGYATYGALTDKLNAKVVSVLLLFTFGCSVLISVWGTICVVMNEQVPYPTIYILRDLGLNLFVLVALVILLRFFNSNKKPSPIPVYVVVGINITYVIGSYLHGLVNIVEMKNVFPVFNEWTIVNLFGTLHNVMFFILIGIMAYVLNNKRKLAVRTAVSE